MKKIITILSLCIFTFISFITEELKAEDAQKYAPVIVGIIDIMKIQAASTLYQGVKEEVSKYTDTLKAELSLKDKEFKTEEEKIKKEKGNLTEKDFEEKVVSFSKKLNEFRVEFEKEKGEFNRRVAETLKEAHIKAVLPSVTEIANKHGVTLVLDKSQAVFFDENIDMTDEVIEVMNKKFPKTDLKKAPAKKAPAKKAPAKKEKAKKSK